jgi:chemotaxis protein MotB
MDSKQSGWLPWGLWLLTVAGAATVGWLGWQHLTALDKSLSERSAEFVAASARVAECDAKFAQLEGKAAAVANERDELIKQRDTLDARTSQLSTTLQQREEELARLTATSRSLEEKLAAEIKRGDVKVTQSEGRIRVDLLDKVLFDSAQADVSPRGEEVLGRLGAILQGIEDRQIQISGHTDDAPINLPDLKAKFPTNWELSAARAVNVVRFLSEKAQVKPARLVVAGYGQYRPIATNATPKGRAANRRIEVLLLPPLEARQAALPSPPTK